jgi:sugar/nucleoside kinase (ribokinase family)
VGSYFLQESLWPDATALYADARARGLTTSLDGNFDPAEQWDSGILGVLAHTDVFFANEQELIGIARAATADEAVELLLDRMPAEAVVVCKLGSEGAVAARRAGGATVRAHAAVPAMPGALVDTVGAGDSLAAGFLAGRLGGTSIERALALGVACGTASTRGAGGVGAQADRASAESLADQVVIRSL